MIQLLLGFFLFLFLAFGGYSKENLSNKEMFNTCLSGNGPICLRGDRGCKIESLTQFCQACELVKTLAKEGLLGCSEAYAYQFVENAYSFDSCFGVGKHDCNCESYSCGIIYPRSEEKFESVVFTSTISMVSQLPIDNTKKGGVGENEDFFDVIDEFQFDSVGLTQGEKERKLKILQQEESISSEIEALIKAIKKPNSINTGELQKSIDMLQDELYFLKKEKDLIGLPEDEQNILRSAIREEKRLLYENYSGFSH